jgi:hypothetical protein
LLQEFLTTYRDAVIATTTERLSARGWPASTADGLKNGVPLFLTQLSETLKLEASPTPFSPGAIGASAAKNGCDLLALGFNLSEVVHCYGDICQAVTQLAIDQNAEITVEEFHTLNRCLDSAIAEAVTGHARMASQLRATSEVERLTKVATDVSGIVEAAVVATHVSLGVPLPTEILSEGGPVGEESIPSAGAK